MLRTEQEASQVRCQESFGAAPVKSNGQSTYVAMFCLGTECMAWRWSEPAEERVGRSATSGKPEGVGWVRVDDVDSRYPDYQYWARPRGDSRRGYCGKVEKPI